MNEIPFFTPEREQARYESRRTLLDAQEALRLELAPGIVFQPETAASVADQMEETLWAEGKTLSGIPEAERRELEASFSVLAPRRETHGVSVAATLFLGFKEEERARRFEEVKGLPLQLALELDGGGLAFPEVDAGYTAGSTRIPAVLALRYRIPAGERPVALISNHAEVPGRWEAPAAWASWAA